MSWTELMGAVDRIGFHAIRVLLSVLWQSSILLMAVVLIAWALRRRRASVRHALWTGALLCTLALPILARVASTIGTPQAEIPVVPAYSPVTVEFAPLPAESAAPPLPEAMLPASSAPALEQGQMHLKLHDYPWALAALGYAAGATVFLLLVLVGRLRLASWVRKGRQVTEPRVLRVFEEARQQLRLRRRCALVESAEVQSPVTIGILRPSVLLPAGLTGRLSDGDLQAIAIHELSHVKRRDPIVLSMASLVRAVLFFHPLVWLACRQISNLAETSCDDAVLDATGEPISYAKMLARLAEGLPSRSLSTELAAGILLSKSAFLRRVEAILSDRRDQIRRLTRLVLAATLAGALLSVAVALALPVGEKREPKALEATESTEEASDESAGGELARLREAVEHFKQLDPIHTPQFGFWAFELTRDYAGHVEAVSPPQSSRQVAKTGPTPADLEFRRVKQEYADLLEYVLLPALAQGLSKGTAHLTMVERLQLYEVAPTCLLQWLHGFTVGQDYDIEARVKHRLRPKLLSVWQRGLDLLQDGDIGDPQAVQARIDSEAENLGLNKEDLDRLFAEMVTRAQPSVFGPVIERVINNDNEETDVFIDLDKGKLFPRPDEYAEDWNAVLAWIKDNGVDAMCVLNPRVWSLPGFEMVVAPVPPQHWDNMPPGNVQEGLRSMQMKPGHLSYMNAKGELPLTYRFKTREGGMGILQIVGFTDDPKGVKIRYKMVQGAGADGNAQDEPVGRDKVEELEARTYDVRDLLPETKMTWGAGKENLRERAMELRELIMTVVRPGTWDTRQHRIADSVREGVEPGELRASVSLRRPSSPGDLVIVHTRKAHAEVEDLLQALRRATSLRVGLKLDVFVVEKGLISEGEAAFRASASSDPLRSSVDTVDTGIPIFPTLKASGTTQVAVHKSLGNASALVGDLVQSSIWHKSGEVVLANGEATNLAGLLPRTKALAIVSHDRRYVALEAAVSVASGQTVEHWTAPVCFIPDNGALLLREEGELAEAVARTWIGPEGAAAVGVEDCAILLLARPQIIARQEEVQEQRPAWGEAVKSDRELCRFIANGIKANRERIVTWKGEATVHSSYRTGESDKSWYTHEATFAYDAESATKRWNYLMKDGHGLRNGEEFVREAGLISRMFKEGVYYSYFWEESIGGPGKVSIRTPDKANIHPLAMDFDPFYFFGYNGGDMYDKMSFYADNFDDPKLLLREIRREGNLVILEYPKGKWRYVFDVSKGCNLVRFETRDPSRGYVGDWKVDYQHVGGAFVPARMVWRREGKKKGEKDVSLTEVEFPENLVNVPLDPSEFELDALGVKPGALVMDQRTGLSYTHKDARQPADSDLGE